MFLIDFFKDLFRSRVTGAQATAKAKAYGVQARARAKVAGTFNRAVDGGIARAKGAVTGGKGGASGTPKTEKGKKMGFWFFGRKRQDSKEAPPPETEDDLEGKTQAINLAEFSDTQFKPCVGWVVVMEGPEKGRDFRLVKGRNRIGREADMEVVLSDPRVSAHHCTIVYTDEGIFQLSDAGSTNGTYLNGKRVQHAQLVDNDTLQVGQTILRFKSLY